MPENKKKTRGNLAVMGRLVGLVKPLAPVMVAAVLLGVAGFLCASWPRLNWRAATAAT